MTPPAAATAAARQAPEARRRANAAVRSVNGGGIRSSSARTAAPRKLKRAPSPRGPRRVSGPVRGRSAAGSPAKPKNRATTTKPKARANAKRKARAATTQARPKARNKSRPQSRAQRSPAPRLSFSRFPLLAGAGTGAAALPAPIGLRLARGVSALPDTALVQRLVRGPGWIVVVAVMLIGIVFMQVSLLELNSGIGKNVEKASALERRNGELRASVSRLSSGERIQTAAARLGMVMPAAGQVHYLGSTVRDGAAAAAALGQGRFGEDARAEALIPIAPPAGTEEAATTDATDTSTSASTDEATSSDQSTSTGETATTDETTDPAAGATTTESPDSSTSTGSTASGEESGGTSASTGGEG